MEKNRRVDVVVKENKNVEMKGSSKAEGSYRMSNSEELEFLNDAIYFSRGGQEFEWQIAKQLDVTEAQKRMKNLLGGDAFPDQLDERLQSYILGLTDIQAQEMLNGLQQLREKLDAGTIIKRAEYIE